MDKKNVHTFHVDKEVNGERYVGSFTVHRPTIGEMMRIGVLEARELGGLSNVDQVTQMMAHMVATLEIVVDMKPEWWKPREILEFEVLQEVFEQYLDFLRRFQGTSQGKPEEAGKGTSQ